MLYLALSLNLPSNINLLCPRLCLFKPAIATGSMAKVNSYFYLNALTPNNVRSAGSLFFLTTLYTRRVYFGLIVLLATVLATRPYLLVMRCSTRKCQRVPSMGSDILSFPITLYQRGEKSQKLFRKETLYKLTWALWLVINL